MTLLQIYALLSPLIGSAFMGSIGLILYRRDMAVRASLLQTASADADIARARAAFEEFLQDSSASADAGAVRHEVS
jgi:uncharacterized membrane protein